MHEIACIIAFIVWNIKSWKVMWDDIGVHVFMSNKYLNCLKNIEKHIFNILKSECDVWLGVMQEMQQLRDLRQAGHD